MFKALIVLCKVTMTAPGSKEAPQSCSWQEELWGVSLGLCQGPCSVWRPFLPRIVQNVANVPSGLLGWRLLMRQVGEGAPGEHILRSYTILYTLPTDSPKAN